MKLRRTVCNNKNNINTGDVLDKLNTRKHRLRTYVKLMVTSDAIKQ
jgi:hypothetical protein